MCAKNKQLIINKSKENSIFKYMIKFRYIVEFIIALIFSINIFYFICNKIYMGENSIENIILLILSFVMLMLNIILNFIIDKKSIEKIFLNLIIPIGILYTVLMLPYKIPDEESHVYRAYNISKLNIIVDTKIQREKIPMDMKNIENLNSYKDIYEVLKNRTDYNSNQIEVFNTFQTYAPIVYIIPSIAFFIGRIFSINIIITILLARLFNLLFFILVGYWSLKKIPFGKIILLLYMFIPMVVHQAASVSADCFINGIAIAFLSYTLYIKYDCVDFNYKRKILFGILAFCISFTKHIYFPLVFLSIIFVVDKKFKRSDKIYALILMLLMTFIAITWFLFTNVYVDVRDYILQNNVNSKLQLEYIFSNFSKFIFTIINTLINNIGTYFYTFLGSQLGLLDINLNKYFLTFYMILLLISPYIEENKYSFKKVEKLFALVIFLGISLLILLGLYMGWTPIGKNIIEGVQGRYFIPIMILPIFCLINKKVYLELKRKEILLFLAILIINIHALVEIVLFYI